MSVGPQGLAASGEQLPETAARALQDLLDRDDPEVVGVVLSGSAGRGLATARSDVDVYVVTDGRPGSRSEVRRRPGIDEARLTLAELEHPAPVGSEGWWWRWSFAWAPVLRDDTSGRVTAAVHRQATLTPAEQDDMLAARLDGYLNFLYRALKDDRDGRPRELRLDAAESLPWLLDVVFALEGRVRPYNKYLPWELREHPLANPAWSAHRLLPLLDAVLVGDPAALRELFTGVEQECLRFDAARGQDTLASIIDSWGTSLRLMRGTDGSHPRP